VRQTYEEVLSRWSRWRDFGKVVEQELALDRMAGRSGVRW